MKTTLTLAERGATTEANLRLVFGSKAEGDEKVAKYYARRAPARPSTAWPGGWPRRPTSHAEAL